MSARQCHYADAGDFAGVWMETKYLPGEVKDKLIAMGVHSICYAHYEQVRSMLIPPVPAPPPAGPVVHVHTTKPEKKDKKEKKFAKPEPTDRDSIKEKDLPPPKPLRPARPARKPTAPPPPSRAPSPRPDSIDVDQLATQVPLPDDNDDDSVAIIDGGNDNDDNDSKPLAEADIPGPAELIKELHWKEPIEIRLAWDKGGKDGIEAMKLLLNKLTDAGVIDKDLRRFPRWTTREVILCIPFYSGEGGVFS
eukprot:Hpha_TRINITY_DN16453_c1_g2::TRINITY_DN16453_c1_g2_i2::g.161214::m.161214